MPVRYHPVGLRKPGAFFRNPCNYPIAFGPCARQDKEQPLLRVAADLKPDVFIFLGDNIYGDSRNMDTLRAKYARLAAKEEFQNLCHLRRHHRDLGCDRTQ
ncbi:MAG: hypothetical protein H6556_17935 [Lewinellaceae bacterium]|nr:hypothetical protein [Lewinellaceae bacterium]